MVTFRPTIDIGAIIGPGGGSVDKEKEAGFKGLWSPGPIDLGLYTGLGLDVGEKFGPHVGIGHMWGENGYIGIFAGLHVYRIGGGAVFPIFPTYGRSGTIQGAMVDKAYRSDFSLYDSLFEAGKYLGEMSSYLDSNLETSGLFAASSLGLLASTYYFMNKDNDL